MLCCGYALTDFPIYIGLASLALWQSNDCPSASEATLVNMDKYFMRIHYERLRGHGRAGHSGPCACFLGYTVIMLVYACHIVASVYLSFVCTKQTIFWNEPHFMYGYIQGVHTSEGMHVLLNNRICDAPWGSTLVDLMWPPCRRWRHGELSNDKPRGRRWRRGCQLAQYYPRCVQSYCVIALAMRQKTTLQMYKLLSHGLGGLHGSHCPMSVEGR